MMKGLRDGIAQTPPVGQNREEAPPVLVENVVPAPLPPILEEEVLDQVDQVGLAPQASPLELPRAPPNSPENLTFSSGNLASFIPIQGVERGELMLDAMPIERLTPVSLVVSEAPVPAPLTLDQQDFLVRDPTQPLDPELVLEEPVLNSPTGIPEVEEQEWSPV